MSVFVCCLCVPVSTAIRRSPYIRSGCQCKQHAHIAHTIRILKLFSWSGRKFQTTVYIIVPYIYVCECCVLFMACNVLLHTIKNKSEKISVSLFFFCRPSDDAFWWRCDTPRSSKLTHFSWSLPPLFRLIKRVVVRFVDCENKSVFRVPTCCGRVGILNCIFGCVMRHMYDSRCVC